MLSAEWLSLYDDGALVLEQHLTGGFVVIVVVVTVETTGMEGDVVVDSTVPLV